MRHSISVLGSGWLGWPLIRQLRSSTPLIKASTTTRSKLGHIKRLDVVPFLINIEQGFDGMESFLDAKTLIINIPSKNIEAFHGLIQCIIKSPISQIIFISSTGVYQNSHQLIHECSKIIDDSPLSKIECLFSDQPAFQTSIIRFGGLFGPDRHPGRFFLKSKRVKNANSCVNFIHLEDCLRIIELVIERGLWNEKLNAVADTHPTRREFYSKACLQLGYVPIFEDSLSPEQKLIANQKLKTLLNYEFIHSDVLKTLDRPEFNF